jgi:hypothetical protein
MIRAGVFVAAVAGFLLAYPPVWWLGLFAFFPALFPRSAWPTAYLGIASLLWIVSTAVDPGRLDLWRLSALAIVLYLVHVGCALLAVLPYDAACTPGIFRPWLLRAGAVSLLTVAGATLITALPHVINMGPPRLAATIAGIVLMVTTAIFIAYLGNRRQ